MTWDPVDVADVKTVQGYPEITN